MSAPAADTARRFLGSTGAAIASQLWRVTIAFGTSLVLRRLVSPEQWGVWNWAEAVFLVLSAVRDLGVATHAVRVHPRPYGTVLLVEAGWGSLLGLATAAAAPWIALACQQPSPDLVPVLRGVALYLVLEGLGSVPLVFFEAELKVRRAVFPEAVRSVIFAGLSIGLALGGHGVWSIVAANLAGSAVYAGLLWARAWGKMPLTWSSEPLPALLRASLPLSLVWVLLFANNYIDRFVLGARFDSEVIGQYGFAYFVASLVVSVMGPPVVRALYPALVALKDDPERLFGAYRLATLFVVVLQVPAALVLYLNAERVLTLLGGDRWLPGAEFLQVLCFASLADPWSRFGGDLLVTLRRDRLWVASLALTGIGYLAGGFLLTGWLGPRGMAWANYLVLGGLLMAWAVRAASPRAFDRLLGDLALVYLAPVPLFFIAGWIAPRGSDLRLVTSAAAALLSLAFYVWRFGPEFRRFFRPASP